MRKLLLLAILPIVFFAFNSFDTETVIAKEEIAIEVKTDEVEKKDAKTITIANGSETLKKVVIYQLNEVGKWIPIKLAEIPANSYRSFGIGSDDFNKYGYVSEYSETNNLVTAFNRDTVTVF